MIQMETTMIKQLALALVLFTPIALLATDKPAITSLEIRQGFDGPLRPVAQHAAPLAANPVPLSTQAPQITPTVSSFLTARQEGNIECKEQKEKADEGKESKLYTSDEDAKILFELMDQPWSHTPCKEVIQAHTLNKFFDALDTYDIQTISAMAEENIGLISQKDHRSKYRDCLRTESAQKLLRFYHEQLLPAADSVPAELWQKLRRARNVLLELPWFDDQFFDAKSLAYSLTKDFSTRSRKICEVPDEITFDQLHNEHLAALLALQRLLAGNDALSRPTICGRIEIVDTLLNILIPRLDAMILEMTPEKQFARSPAINIKRVDLQNIRWSLEVLLAFSTIANSSAKCQKANEKIFHHIGLKITENYPAIARKLVRAFIHVVQTAEQYWWSKKCEQSAMIEAGQPRSNCMNFLGNRSPLDENLGSLLHHAMMHGSPEMFQIISAEMADIKRDPRNGVHQDADPRHYDQFELMARDAVNGEKLGILLSLNAHAESAPHMLAMGMLSRVEKNPRLLSRLKKYIRRYQKTDALINTQASGHLLPVLAPCVAHYVHYMPADIQNYILNLRPAIQAAQPAGQQENDNEGILGEHMTALMQQQSRNGNNDD